jgi:hypothetical protein
MGDYFSNRIYRAVVMLMIGRIGIERGRGALDLDL